MIKELEKFRNELANTNSYDTVFCSNTRTLRVIEAITGEEKIYKCDLQGGSWLVEVED